jgi:hypothetical protein
MCQVDLQDPTLAALNPLVHTRHTGIYDGMKIENTTCGLHITVTHNSMKISQVVQTLVGQGKRRGMTTPSSYLSLYNNKIS